MGQLKLETGLRRDGDPDERPQDVYSYELYEKLNLQNPKRWQ
ncbi:hypothetical protein JCM19233_5809 [Vibrio astriarenae]|nr:hypothetical protein JCM19233_5809 [Vibrio sp. C7]